MQLEVTTIQVSSFCLEQRFYDSDGKLVEVRKIYSPRPGSINNTMRIHPRNISPGTAGDPDVLTG